MHGLDTHHIDLILNYLTSHPTYKLSLSNLFTYSSIFRSYLHIILQHSKVILLISNYISSLYLSITVMDLTINYLTKTGLPDNQLMSRI